eukprot:TRINITY_DN1359_c0_g1_i2.p2 TRINITY_DN1359_c0_g1~~TRINITY_DN1359_c0_g1_i2.p2  ORF type:complete len:104 (-),score=6.06 TRINITY_DN1359_c0_g1_i2:1276-1587(-)
MWRCCTALGRLSLRKAKRVMVDAKRIQVKGKRSSKLVVGRAKPRQCHYSSKRFLAVNLVKLIMEHPSALSNPCSLGTRTDNPASANKRIVVPALRRTAADVHY